MDLPEPEVPEAPLYSAAHQNLTRALGCHCQTLRGTAAALCVCREHCCPLLAPKHTKPEEISSGRMRMAAGSAGMDAGQEGPAEIAAAFGARGLIRAAGRCHPK